MDTTLPVAEDSRIKILEETLPLVATLADLALKTKHAHWNLRGDDGYSAHKLLDELNDELLELTDTLAERCGALGGYVPGVPSAILKGTRLSEFPQNGLLISTAFDYLTAIQGQLTEASRAFRLADEIVGDKTNVFSDSVTSNILQEMIGRLERMSYLTGLNKKDVT